MTISEMLTDRGYALTSEERNMTYDGFVDMYGEQFTTPDQRESLTFLAGHKDNPSDQIFVFFCADRKIQSTTLQNYDQKMQSQDVNRAILIYRGEISSRAAEVIESVAHERRIERFKETELIVNITKHQWVPPHSIMSPQQVDTLLKRYKVAPSQLPRMEVTDPIARYHGLSVGQIVKIIRTSETAGRYITYRRVVYASSRNY